MLNPPIPQNRTKKQHEQLIYDTLRERCQYYVEAGSKKHAAEASVEIKELLRGLNLDDSYHSLMKNLNMQRKLHKLHNLVSHYE